LAWIKNENEKLGKKTYGITEFIDMTHEEFVEKMLMKPEHFEREIENMKEKSLRFLHESNEDHHDDDHHDDPDDDNHDHDLYDDDDDDHDVHYEIDSENLQDSANTFEHRQYLGPAKSQGGCGSCWAFAAIAVIEAGYSKMKGKLTLFSEQHLVDCDTRDGGCNGGWPSNTLRWIKDNGVIEADMSPYKGTKRPCNSAQYENSLYKILDGYELASNNADKWKDLSMKGPIIVGMDASSREFMNYKPRYLMPVVPSKCGRLNHAVVVVGNYFIDRKEILIVRNSWGTRWGDEGHFAISKERSCGITNLGWLPVMKNSSPPSPDPKPTPPTPPKPTPPTPDNDNCVELYGINSQPITKVCGGNADVKGGFYGIKFPPRNRSKKRLTYYLFSWEQCAGFRRYRVSRSISYISRRGVKQKLLSLTEKKDGKNGCVSFFNQTCLLGDPIIEICNDVPDTQSVNSFSEMASIKSLLQGKGIRKIYFYSEENFKGTQIVIYGRRPLFNTLMNWRLKMYFESKKIRSIKIEKR
jgi:C1A family cysteine protease